MTKIEQLAQTATRLSEEQLDGPIDYARYLASEPIYRSATAAVLASIERGLAQSAAGETAPADEVFARLDRKLATASE